MADVSLREGALVARDGTELHTFRWSGAAAPSRGVVFVHGYLEHAARYGEMGAYLAARGYTCFANDHRGHGRSGGMRAYVRDFWSYVDDLDVLVESAAREIDRSRLFLVGHSMGGVIALMSALRHRDVSGVAVSSPYLRNAVPVAAPQRAALQVLARVAPRLSVRSPLRAEDVSSDPVTVSSYATDPLVLHHYRAGWALALLRAQSWTMDHAPELRLPLLVIVAGADRVADPAASRAFYARAGSTDKTLISYDEHFHENFNEPDRTRAFAELERWLAARSS